MSYTGGPVLEYFLWKVLLRRHIFGGYLYFCGLSILCCYIAVFVTAQFVIQRPLILATFTEDNGRKDEHLPPYPDQLAFHRVPSLGLCSEQ